MILIDIDGVVINFCEKVFETFSIPFSAWDELVDFNAIEDVYQRYTGNPVSTMWAYIYDNPDFWYECRATSYVDSIRDLVRSCEYLDVPYYFVTAHPPELGGHKQKADQVIGMIYDEYDDVDMSKFVFCKDKYILAAPGRVLIDDSTENINKFGAAGGKGILVGQKWNGGKETWKTEQEIRALIEELEK